uniref:Uncharacterized protein n=1 Tax=Trieres chinensis TaxID=1514140 RepID=A0A7S1ZHG0_TRICV
MLLLQRRSILGQFFGGHEKRTDDPRFFEYGGVKLTTTRRFVAPLGGEGEGEGDDAVPLDRTNTAIAFSSNSSLAYALSYFYFTLKCPDVRIALICALVVAASYDVLLGRCEAFDELLDATREELDAINAGNYDARWLEEVNNVIS